MMATITLTNATIAADAASGSVIGTFNVSGLQVLKTDPNVSYFSVSGKNLIGTWSSPPTVKSYDIWVFVINSPPATLKITITAAVTLPGNLIAEWSLTSASVSGTTVADASGSSHTATVVNGPLIFGAVGATFNGQQYMDSALTMTSPALTVSSWFNASNLNNSNPRIVANSHTDVDAKGFQLMFNGGGGSGFFDVGNGTTEGRASWSQQLVAGHLYHYTGVYDGATVKAYLNGVQVASTAFAGGPIAAGTGPHINVARNPVYASDYFQGSIADVRIYNKALAAADVLALFNAGVPVTAPPPPPPAVPSSVTLTPTTVSLPDNSPAGTAVSTIAVPMSDGSAFAGSLAVSANNMVAISGTKVVLSRALSASDGGTKSYTITATQGGNSKTASLSVTVARTLTLSLTSPPQIPDNSPSGTLVSTATVQYSDGTQPAAITLTSSDTTFIKVQGTQLVLARAMTTTDDGTHNVTITASDGLGAFATARMFGGTAAAASSIEGVSH